MEKHSNVLNEKTSKVFHFVGPLLRSEIAHFLNVFVRNLIKEGVQYVCVCVENIPISFFVKYATLINLFHIQPHNPRLKWSRALHYQNAAPFFTFHLLLPVIIFGRNCY